jgi:hypothetical protein
VLGLGQGDPEHRATNPYVGVIPTFGERQTEKFEIFFGAVP